MPETEIPKVDTVYDKLYAYFVSITKVDKYDFPFTVEGQYDLINNALMEFNLIREDNLVGNNESENFNRELTELEFMLLGNCMKLITFNNMLSDFTSTYSMFQKEVGFKDYKSQLEARTWIVEGQKGVIDDILFKMQEDFQ